jgi:hypothetical protein
MKKPCLVNPKLINKIRQRDHPINYINDHMIYMVIGIFIGFVLIYIYNKKEEFITPVVTRLLTKEYKKKYSVKGKIQDEEIEYKGIPHNVYIT